MSAKRPLGTGRTKGKSNVSKPAVATEDTKFPLKLQMKMRNSSTPEFHQKNKNKTCSDKLVSLKNVIQTTQLSKTLAVDLTSKEKVSEEYWNDYSKEISKKLSYHHLIDFQDLEQENFSVGSLEDLELNLSYSIAEHVRVLTRNSQETYLKLLPSLQPDTTVAEVTQKKTKPVKKAKLGHKVKKEKEEKEREENITQITRKIRIYPNQQQKLLFKKCAGAHRYFYNKAVQQLRKNNKIIYDLREKAKIIKLENGNLVENEKLLKEAKSNTEFIPIRNEVIINDDELTDENKWMEEIPYDTRQLAVKTLIDARDSAESNKKNDNILCYKLHYLDKKTSNDVFIVNKKALIDGSIFKRRLKKNSPIKTSKKNEELIKKSKGDFPIVREKDGRYYACITIEPIDTKLDVKANICALDPGIRTFQTMYSEKSIGEFGYNTSKTLFNLYRREDKLKSIIATKPLKSSKKCKLKKRCALLRTKVKHVVQDLHWKTCDYLTKNYQVILLPIFNSKQMANKKKRKIRKTTTRLLLGLSHYQFQQKLLYKAKMRDRNVIICKEHYTTKCCGNCGTLNHKMAGKKIFHCKNCNLTMDRDIHAARNILIRNLTINSLRTPDKI